MKNSPKLPFHWPKFVDYWLQPYHWLKKCVYHNIWAVGCAIYRLTLRWPEDVKVEKPYTVPPQLYHTCFVTSNTLGRLSMTQIPPRFRVSSLVIPRILSTLSGLAPHFNRFIHLSFSIVRPSTPKYCTWFALVNIQKEFYGRNRLSAWMT